jgi:hypothetical protein
VRDQGKQRDIVAELHALRVRSERTFERLEDSDRDLISAAAALIADLEETVARRRLVRPTPPGVLEEIAALAPTAKADQAEKIDRGNRAADPDVTRAPPSARPLDSPRPLNLASPFPPGCDGLGDFILAWFGTHPPDHRDGEGDLDGYSFEAIAGLVNGLHSLLEEDQVAERPPSSTLSRELREIAGRLPPIDVSPDRAIVQLCADRLDELEAKPWELPAPLGELLLAWFGTHPPDQRDELDRVEGYSDRAIASLASFLSRRLYAAAGAEPVRPVTKCTAAPPAGDGPSSSTLARELRELEADLVSDPGAPTRGQRVTLGEAADRLEQLERSDASERPERRVAVGSRDGQVEVALLDVSGVVRIPPDRARSLARSITRFAAEAEVEEGS